ncbi:MAG: bifunctional helix-turn-helix transcriptional regulator/GNAT family N-acetyltransferase [Longimicrobiales bacterium]
MEASARGSDDGNRALERIAAVRRFSRFYTKRIGVLEEGLLRTRFSLAEARVLYELAHHESTTATTLAGELGLDAGYLSRILRRLQRRGLVARTSSPRDGRRKPLALTATGQVAFAELNAASRRDIAAMLDDLSVGDQERLVSAMGAIESLLGAREEQRVPYILRPHQAGDMGWVVQRHGVLYAQEFGWDERFEGLVAEIVAGFIRDFDPKRERCWVAEKDGENVGSVFCVRNADDVAQLRLLLVEPKARGLGIGRRLVQECLAFARRTGYRSIMLWTNDVLHAARRIYEAEGFRLVHEEPHDSFGDDLVGQTWELQLGSWSPSSALR